MGHIFMFLAILGNIFWIEGTVHFLFLHAGFCRVYPRVQGLSHRQVSNVQISLVLSSLVSKLFKINLNSGLLQPYYQSVTLLMT